jgi:hypothetical protein
MATNLSWILFGLGALFCLINFYISFLRYPLHRLRGLSKESYHWVSGFPLVGTLCVALSLGGLHEVPGMIPAVIVLILMDTGGLLWFIGVMIFQSVFNKSRN